MGGSNSRRRPTKKENNSKENNDTQEKHEEAGNDFMNSRELASNLERHLQFPLGEPVFDIRNHLEKKYTDNEFRLIELKEDSKDIFPEGTKEEALNQKNKSKNRYEAVVPYDYNRVKLQTANNMDDYINASYVKGDDVTFIAAQGPLKDTVDDFWRMIWENDIHIVLMLTEEIENDRVKCFRYWPETNDPSEAFHRGDLKLKLISSETKEGISVQRKYRLTNKMQPETKAKKVVQLQFLAWPDHSIPKSPSVVLDLIETIDNLRKESNTNSPILIHCSAGIGRTGSFLAIYFQVTKLRKHMQTNPNEPFPFEIYKTVLELRKQRSGMIQESEQYRFCYQVLLYEAERLGMKFPSTKTEDDKDKANEKEAKENPGKEEEKNEDDKDKANEKEAKENLGKEEKGSISETNTETQVKMSKKHKKRHSRKNIE